MSTAEIENAIARLGPVVEAAIVGKPDKLRGMVPIAFVKTKRNIKKEKILKAVSNKIGPIAKPAEIYFVKDIPKTRSGKIMRRVIKALIHNKDPGDISTLKNPEAVAEVKKLITEQK